MNKFHKTCWRCNRIPIVHGESFHVARKAGQFVYIDLCDSCYSALSRSVTEHRKRARKAGSNYTLTINQWLDMLQKSNGNCAYCKASVGYLSLTLDHIIPIANGGATTLENVIPACKKCNTSKRTKNVAEWQGV